MLILKVTNYLKVDFTEFAWAVFWLPTFYFELNSFIDLLSFSSLGIVVHILVPKKRQFQFHISIYSVNVL